MVEAHNRNQITHPIHPQGKGEACVDRVAFFAITFRLAMRRGRPSMNFEEVVCTIVAVFEVPTSDVIVAKSNSIRNGFDRRGHEDEESVSALKAVERECPSSIHASMVPNVFVDPANR